MSRSGALLWDPTLEAGAWFVAMVLEFLEEELLLVILGFGDILTAFLFPQLVHITLPRVCSSSRLPRS